METKKGDVRRSKSVYRRKNNFLNPLMPKSSIGNISNSMTIPKSNFSIVWRPNNYRRQIKIKNPPNSVKLRTIDSTYKVQISEHTKIITIKDFKPNITIQIAKNTITGIFKQNMIGGHKETYLIEADKPEQLDKRIDQKKAEIKIKIDSAIKEASKIYMLEAISTPIWTRHEDFIKGDDFIDKIPKETIIHDTFFKKVYSDGVEFFGGKGKEPTTYIKNYLKNRAIEDLSPVIAEAIDRLTLQQSVVMDGFSRNIAHHLDVLKKIDRGITRFSGVVSKLNRLQKPKSSKKRKYGLTDKEMEILREA